MATASINPVMQAAPLTARRPDDLLALALAVEAVPVELATIEVGMVVVKTDGDEAAEATAKI